MDIARNAKLTVTQVAADQLLSAAQLIAESATLVKKASQAVAGCARPASPKQDSGDVTFVETYSLSAEVDTRFLPSRCTITKAQNLRVDKGAEKMVKAVSLMRKVMSSSKLETFGPGSVSKEALFDQLFRECPYRLYRGKSWLRVILEDRGYFVHMMTCVMNVNSASWHILVCFLTQHERELAIQNASENTRRVAIPRDFKK